MKTVEQYSLRTGVADASSTLLASDLGKCAQMLSEFNLRNSAIQTDAANLLRDRDRMSAETLKERAQVIANEISKVRKLGQDILDGCKSILSERVLEQIEREIGALGGYEGTLRGMIRDANFQQLGDVLRGIVNTAGNIMNGIGDFIENLPPLPMRIPFPQRVM